MKNNHIYVVAVDDNPDEGLLMARIFAKMETPPVDLCVLNDGRELYEMLKNPAARIPSLILLDNKMPFMSGIESLRGLMQLEHIRSIPVVILSTEFSKSELREAYKLGVRSCVVKCDDAARWNRVLRGLVTYWLEINQPCDLCADSY